MVLPSSAAPWPSSLVDVSYELVVVFVCVVVVAVVGLVVVAVVGLVVVVQMESESSDVDTAVDTDEYNPEPLAGHAMCRENRL